MASRVTKRRVMVLVHEDLVPPSNPSSVSEAEAQEFRTEHNVIQGLRELGHDVKALGLSEEVAPLRKALKAFKPHVVFNLLEEFRGQPMLDYHVVAYLVLRGAAYTGCNPRGLLIARDKALSKKILHYHRILVPAFTTVVRGRRARKPKRLEYPLIVKSLTQEASLGIAQASVVNNDDALSERVKFIHEKVGTDAIVEQYIVGREVYSAVVGNRRLEVFPTWEMDLSGLPAGDARIATRAVKWDLAYQKKHGIDIAEATGLSVELQRKISTTTKRICRRLNVDGYIRVDYRLSEDGKLYFLEANPNPDIAYGEEFSSAAKAAGLDYNSMLQRIVNLGIRRGARPIGE
jgi:D-alanine-D-alanine ligase